MYLRINYQWCGKEATNDLFLFAAAFLPQAQHREAISLDGLRIIFQTLEEASIRIEEKLSQLGMDSNTISSEGATIVHEEQLKYASVMSDVWILIDNIRRSALFLKYIPGIPNNITGSKFEAVIEEIKDLRDSIHHIDERVKSYFTKQGDSILGDILWRSRAEVNLVERLNILASGVRRIRREELHLGQPQEDKFLSRTGIYDLRIKYVSKKYNRVLKRYDSEKRIEVNIENAIEVINKIITFLNKKYSDFLHKKMAEAGNESANISFPLTFGISLTQEAWDAKNKLSE